MLRTTRIVYEVMVWDSKFIGGHLEINNRAGSKVTAYSKTDNDKVSFCNPAENVVEAWWQGSEVYVKIENGVIKRFYNSSSCH